MTEPVIAADDLRVWYGTARGPVKAVDGVSFEVHEGETLGLVGESGCGKSTLGRAILGLLPPGTAMDGELRFTPSGQDSTDLVTLPRKQLEAMRGPQLGLVFQEPMTRLNPLMRISQHFEEALKIHEPSLRGHAVKERAIEALRHVGIPPSRYTSYPHEFSGGMRQRIMIALTLVLRPAFMVADEPTTALDVLVEAQILALLSDLRRDFRTAMLLITHNLGIIAEACDRVAVMYAGKIVEMGDARDVFRDPQHPYTQELLASTISLATTDLHSIPGAPPDLADPPRGCHFHPRCPKAMRVCAQADPVDVRLGDGRTLSCWLHGPKDQVPPDGTAPLEREAISVADEA